MRLFRFLSLSALLVLLAACMEQQGGNAAGGASAADSAGAVPDTLTVARTDTVRVRLSEFSIDVVTSLRTGPTVFRVRNDGEWDHSFGIEGNAGKHTFRRPLAPGEVRTLKMTLRDGTYKIYCPMDDHAKQGMQVQLAVENDEPTG